jgi:hypothetical protein
MPLFELAAAADDDDDDDDDDDVAEPNVSFFLALWRINSVKVGAIKSRGILPVVPASLALIARCSALDGGLGMILRSYCVCRVSDSFVSGPERGLLEVS